MKKKEDLIKTSEEIRKALLTNNLEVLKRCYSEDFQGFDVRGETENIDLIFTFYKPGAAKLETLDVLEQTTEVFSEVGVIRGKCYLKGIFDNYEFEHTIRFTDIYLYEEGKWKCYRSHATEIRKT